jgi:hypothetical protein
VARSMISLLLSHSFVFADSLGSLSETLNKEGILGGCQFRVNVMAIRKCSGLFYSVLALAYKKIQPKLCCN